MTQPAPRRRTRRVSRRARSGTAFVTAGRLTVDEDGDPTLVPAPAAPAGAGEDCEDTGRELQGEQIPPPEGN